MKNISLSTNEIDIINKIKDLKLKSGSHSPSIFTIKEKIPQLEIKVDACFLSNPYATDLFLEYFKKELVSEEFKLRDLLEFYPSQNEVIAESISKYVGVPKEQVFVGNGAIEIIQAIIHNFSKKILVNIPTFSSYYEFMKDEKSVAYNILKEENLFQLDIEDYIQKVKNEKPDTVVLINPNNPDGGYLPFLKLKYLLEQIKDVENIIIDESFIHFAYENEEFDLISYYSDLLKQFPNLICIKSMSKDFGIAGIRAGYGIMPAAKKKTLLENGYLWNSNGLAEYFFRLYVREDFQKKYDILRRKYIKETSAYFQELSKIENIIVYPSKANFALIEVRNGMTSDDFVAVLLAKYGIYTRTGSDKIGLEGGQYIRIASRTKSENDAIINAMNDLFH